MSVELGETKRERDARRKREQRLAAGDEVRAAQRAYRSAPERRQQARAYDARYREQQEKLARAAARQREWRKRHGATNRTRRQPVSKPLAPTPAKTTEVSQLSAPALLAEVIALAGQDLWDRRGGKRAEAYAALLLLHERMTAAGET